MSLLSAWLLVAALAGPPPGPAPRPSPGGVSSAPAPAGVDSCRECHGNQSDRWLSGPVHRTTTDAHGVRGILCHDCHGGDPSRGLDDLDPDAAHDAKRGFVGVPRPEDVPALCARCHGDPLRMGMARPSMPTNQHALYLTSAHGRALAAGNRHSPSCSACHQAHGCYAPADARSSVHPSREPSTCGGCHADRTKVGPTLARGRPLRTDPLALYDRSVHGRAARRGDRSAPVCHDCHGNHALVPPADLVAACGRCHPGARTDYEAGRHARLAGFPGCVACHGSHEVGPASDALLADDGPCARCHRASDLGMALARTTRLRLAALTASIEAAGGDLTRHAGLALPLGPLRRGLEEARRRLDEARRLVHTDTAGRIDRPLVRAQSLVDQAARERDRLETLLVHRRWGATVVAGILLFSSVALWRRFARSLGP